ncbi:NAD(P)/FAD-dependent oxidoreductase [Kitasatospora sp. NPDC051853]|uniref:NAD(P)/FAD-dependent oxidoreductase n=1 Tax=Kitasatospora sp. NPDC051853 TaxID=3364058 RepID=UPI00378B2895
MDPVRSGSRSGTGHAVVLGAGIGGLCAARALSGHFERVTLVERDTFPGAPAVRRGVPQGAHVHSLTAAGAEVLDGFFPGFVAELVDGGGTFAGALDELDIVFFGSRLRQVPLGRVLQVSRPFLEDRLRERVAALPDVSLRQGFEAAGPITAESVTAGPVTPDGAPASAARAGGVRVSGVRLARAGTAGSFEDLAADLVVDAMGRAGRGAAWLRSLGYPAPAEKRLHVDVGYASRRFRVPPGGLGAAKGVLVGATPARPRGLVLTQQEGDAWVLSLYGFGRGNHPPETPEEFLAFAGAMLPAATREALGTAEAITGISSFKYPDCVRREYHRLRRVPEGLVSVGDAVCSLNPIYGAGMTVAALEARALQTCLADGPEGLPRRFYREAARAVRLPWLFSTMADRAMPQVPGTHPAVARLLGRAFGATMRAAAADARVATSVWNAVSLSGSPAGLAHPLVTASVVRHWSPGTATGPGKG